MKIIPKDPMKRAKTMSDHDLERIIQQPNLEVGMRAACLVEQKRRAVRRQFFRHDIVAWVALALSLFALWRSW